ncbi:MAG: cytochrome c [Pseudomonadota bacterium]
MMRLLIGTAGIVVAAALVWLLVPFPVSTPVVEEIGDAERGAYVFRMGGCASCHTDSKNGGALLAGGRALETPFGTFYTSNLTPDPGTGIGGWTTGDFVQAMTKGLSPQGHDYYPSFPYTSYANMTNQDLADLKAYLDTVEPVNNPVPPHALNFPFNFRALLKPWKAMFLRAPGVSSDPEKSDAWNRGAYLVNGPGHCGECHTPRNMLGALDRSLALAGTREGPDGDPVPNITPHDDDGIGGWSTSDITFALQTGILPDGDVFGGAMSEVVRDNTSHLTPEDRAAIAEYLLSLDPLTDAQPAQAEDV